MNAKNEKNFKAFTQFIVSIILAFLIIGIPRHALCMEPVNLLITAGTAGGGYYRACAAFAEYIKKDIPGSTVTVIPGGAWANLDRLATKKADIAIIENSAATVGFKGKAPAIKAYPEIRMLASIRGPSLDQVMVLEKTGLKSFEEIKQRKYPVRVYMLERASLNTSIAIDIFKAYGIKVEDIKSWGGKVVYTSFRELTRQIGDGLGDAFAGGGILYPQTNFIQIGSKERYRLLPISKEVAQKVGEIYGVGIIEVEKDLYKEHNGINEPYWSTNTVLCLAVRKDLDDEIVYNLAKVLENHKEDLWKVHPQHKFYKPQEAWKNVGAVPLHPGAEKYYKSMGYMPK